MGAKMDYTVATDMNGVLNPYRLLGVRGIPHAFIIDKSRNVVWSGHPMMPDFEDALTTLVAGRSILPTATPGAGATPSGAPSVQKMD